MAYTALVAKIKTRPHPGADRLLLGTVAGSQVVVGLDTVDGEIGLFFPTNGQLSHEFCVHNGLYSASACKRLSLDTPPKPGFIDHNRRVRSQSFRQEKSDGLWVPLSYLEWTGSDPASLKEGDTFVEFGGYEICKKYFTPSALRALGAGNKLKRREALCFPKHEDTAQFRFVADSIPEDAVLYVTEKLHGTSGRYGLVWDDIEQGWWGDLISRLFGRPRGSWTYLNGSRNVILEKTTGAGYYGTNDFRYDVVKDLQLHKGEVLYFEIVGYVQGSQTIMPPHDVSKTGLKALQERYGPQIAYTYGCPEGVHRAYVYKIVNVNVDGVARELPWPQVVARCGELGLVHVPLLAGPLVMRGLDLRALVEGLTEGSSVLNALQIREGVVLRAESSRGVLHIKNKQWAFGVLEGYLAEKDTFVDPEDVS